MGPYGSKKIQNATPPPVFIRSDPNFIINKLLVGEYNVMEILAICQNFRNVIFPHQYLIYDEVWVRSDENRGRSSVLKFLHP